MYKVVSKRFTGGGGQVTGGSYTSYATESKARKEFDRLKTANVPVGTEVTLLNPEDEVLERFYVPICGL